MKNIRVKDDIFFKNSIYRFEYHLPASNSLTPTLLCLVCHVHTQYTLRQRATQLWFRKAFLSFDSLITFLPFFDLWTMNQLKEKLNAYKFNTEAAEERQKEAVEKCREVERCVEAKIEEKESLKRRMAILSNECTICEKQYSEKKKKLDEFLQRLAEDDEARKVLEEEDREADETISGMEEKVAESLQYAMEMENKLADAQRKLVVVERELHIADSRLETNKKRAKDLEGDIEQGGENLRKLEEKDAQSADRDEEYEKKIKFLEDQVSETIKRCEEAEMLVSTKERDSEQIERELTCVSDKINAVRAEFDNIADLGND